MLNFHQKIKINQTGKVLKTTRPLMQKMAVGNNESWEFYAKTYSDLCDGLVALGKKELGLKKTETGSSSCLHVWVKHYELPNRACRPSVLGVGTIPGYGLAKRIANVRNKTWAVWINAQPKDHGRGTTGWTHVWDTRDLSKNVLTCKAIGNVCRWEIKKILDGIKD